jgi:fructose-1,6-bisphosphatase/inositol monophosphatase family enzyme
MDFNALADIATKAALEAGKIIQSALHKTIDVKHKKGGNTLASQVVTSVDKACEKIILKYLTPTCNKYNLGLLTEETEDDQSRFIMDYFWCIDPLDGTLAFINKHPGFSVSIALVSKEGIPVIGVVLDPSTDTLYVGIKDQGAFKNGKRWVLTQPKNTLTYVTDKTLANTPQKEQILGHIEKHLKELCLTQFKEVSGGGAVLNALLVAEHRPALLIKPTKTALGGGSLWDFAATVCIFKELDLKATSYIGRPLDLNSKTSTFLNTQGVYFGAF